MLTNAPAKHACTRRRRWRRGGRGALLQARSTSVLLPCPAPWCQDLLPAELASKQRGASPMRAGGSPPKAHAEPPPPPPMQADAGSPAPTPVDGVPDGVVDAWFRLADADGDGRVADTEAREFFLTSGLPPADLSKVGRPVLRHAALLSNLFTFPLFPHLLAPSPLPARRSGSWSSLRS